MIRGGISLPAAKDAVQNAVIKIYRHIDKNTEVKCKKTRSYIVIIVKGLCLGEHILKIEKSAEIARQLDNYTDLMRTYWQCSRKLK